MCGPVASGFGCGALAAVDGVLHALFGAGVVPPVAVAVGDGDVGLLDVAEHLVVELVAEAGERGHDGFGVGVFGFKVGGDFGILLVAEPGVVVGEGDAVQDGLFWLNTGDRGAGNRLGRNGCGRDRVLVHLLFSVLGDGMDEWNGWRIGVGVGVSIGFGLRGGQIESPAIGAAARGLGTSGLLCGEAFVFFGPFGFCGPLAREAALGLFGRWWGRLGFGGFAGFGRLCVGGLDEGEEEFAAAAVPLKRLVEDGLGEAIAVFADDADDGFAEALQGVAADAFGLGGLSGRCFVCHRYLLGRGSGWAQAAHFVLRAAKLYLVKNM